MFDSDFLMRPITKDEMKLVLENDRKYNSLSGQKEKKERAQSILFKMIAERRELALADLDKMISDEEFNSKGLDDALSKLDFAYEIYELLVENEMWIDTYIYTCGACLGTSNKEQTKFRYNRSPFVFLDEPTNHFKYVRDPNILSMSFEGPLYDVLNGYTHNREFENKFEKIFKKYGVYYELGNAWNLTCCPLEEE